MVLISSLPLMVAHSPGLTPDEPRELAVWGPSHDSLVDRRDECSSTNFFQLASGAYCVVQHADRQRI